VLSGAALPCAEPPRAVLSGAEPPCAEPLRAALACAAPVQNAEPPAERQALPAAPVQLSPVRHRVEFEVAARRRLSARPLPVLPPAPAFSFALTYLVLHHVQDAVPSFNRLNGPEFANPAVGRADVIEDECFVIFAHT
jgi:hypothetical protein